MLFFFGVLEAFACTCDNFGETVAEAYRDYENIAIFKVVDTHRNPEKKKYAWADYVTHVILRVEKVYKGDFKVGETLVSRNSDGEGCVGGYSNVEKGKKYIFYMGQKKDFQYAKMSYCSRTASLTRRRADIPFLEKLSQIKGKTRLSGTVSKIVRDVFTNKIADRKYLADWRIRIKGNGREFEVVTNEKGVFEVYGLPVWKYEIMPYPIENLKISNRFRNLGNSEIFEEGGHAELNLLFVDDTACEESILFC